MKQKTKLYFTAVLLVTAFAVSSCGEEKSKVDEGKMLASTEIKVWGNCEMCQETIEESLHTKGIKSASWNTETKILSVKYDSTIISLDSIHKKVAASGYDTEKYKATEESYRNLHECCQYERRP